MLAIQAGAAKQGAQFGRGDEIAAVPGTPAKLDRAAGVITETRCVQTGFHELCKADPAARRLDFFPEAVSQCGAALQFIGAGHRQGGGGGSILHRLILSDADGLNSRLAFSGRQNNSSWMQKLKQTQ